MDRLSDDELAYHVKALEDAKRAQADALKAIGAVESYSRHLVAKYRLVDGDRIDPDGSIVRAISAP